MINYRKLKEEWKKSGEIPEWYSTNALQFFMEKYSYKGESVKSRDETTNKTLALFAPKEYPEWWNSNDYFKGLTWEQAFNKLDVDGFLVKSTPVKANVGLPERGLSVSCCGQELQNKISGKAFTMAELEVLIKNSHGCSMTISDWLAKGTIYDADGNRSEGIEPIIDNIQKTTFETNQGVRRGQTLIGVNADHGDFWVVAKKLFNESDNLNIAWLLTDDFISRLEGNDTETVARWNKMIYIRMAKGKGYITKIDTMNRNKAQIFKDLNMVVKGSNLCVAPETEILTSEGYQVIADLEGKEVDVWNGVEWSKTKVVKTGVNQQLFEIVVRVKVGDQEYTEKSLTCTAYHKWYDVKGNEVRTADLVHNLELLGWVDPEGNEVQSYISEIRDDGRVDDTLCFTETKRHMGVFNGVLTGQCNEVNLPVNHKYSFTCVILNGNLTLFRQFPEHFWFVVNVMQDCNVSYYISEIEKKTGFDKLLLQRVLDFTKDFRAVGTGVCGFHSLLMQEKIVFGSIESFHLNNKIFKEMRKDLEESSMWLARVLGEPEMMKGTGYRNATLMMLPPTKSSTEMARNTPSESINPMTALIRVKETTGGDIFRIEPVLLRLMKEKGIYTDELVQDIARHKGSVQHLDCFTDEEKAYLRIAFEVPMESHLDLCSQRQKYIDQQQSINLYLASHDSEEYIAEIHKKAVLDDMINGLYYCYSSRGGDYERFGCEMCQ